jgi:hypothetical protein
MPDREEFDPAAYLAHFHRESSMEQLLAGREHLQSNLSRGHGQLKALVKENFGRFLRCVVRSRFTVTEAGQLHENVSGLVEV